MQERMYGVVLWADERDSKAVIWCEDHGNLAYYSASVPSPDEGISLDAGDLIQFDMREEAACRRARNLRRVDAGHASGLAASLRRSTRRGGAEVIAFPGR